jgi:hypothetical protein
LLYTFHHHFYARLTFSLLLFSFISIDGVDPSAFDCVYSPAKRRGPIPGRTAGQARKAGEMSEPSVPDWNESQFYTNNITSSHNLVQNGGLAQSNNGMMQSNNGMMNNNNGMMQSNNGMMQSNNGMMSNNGMAQGNMNNNNNNNNNMAQGNMDNIYDNMETSALQQQLTLLQQLQQQQVGMMRPEIPHEEVHEPSSRRVKVEEEPVEGGIPRTITNHAHLLERSDPDGSRLRAYYRLSIDELFQLPPTPTDEEYCSSYPGMTPQMIPGSHLAALSAARFAEVALGAVVHNETSLAMELCNAVVHCLRESVQEPVQPPVMYEVAKSYFLLGVFRACRGDMTRYFKYRRVCMSYVGKFEVSENVVCMRNELLCI